MKEIRVAQSAIDANYELGLTQGRAEMASMYNDGYRAALVQVMLKLDEMDRDAADMVQEMYDEFVSESGD